MAVQYRWLKSPVDSRCPSLLLRRHQTVEQHAFESKESLHYEIATVFSPSPRCPPLRDNLHSYSPANDSSLPQLQIQNITGGCYDWFVTRKEGDHREAGCELKQLPTPASKPGRNPPKHKIDCYAPRITGIFLRHLRKRVPGLRPRIMQRRHRRRKRLLCHAISQPYVAYSPRSMVVLAGCRKAVRFLCAGSSTCASATAIEIETSRGSSLN
uniref:Uncharacterized protein n=1 Tax=Salmonella sp. TaxID=599 RepID=A0A482ETH6_SALSP|nr:hypothetical protein NNIBIDOC_00090 [Salmonella sp.]